MSRTLARIQSVLGDPRIVRALVLFVAAGVLLYLTAIFWLGWRDTAAALSVLGPQNMLGGAALASSSYLMRFGRWESSLRCFGYRVPWRRQLAIYLSGLGLTATPGKSGETFRSALLLQQEVRLSHSLAAFLVDRASDVLGMCLLGFMAACLSHEPLAWAWMLAFSTMLLGSCLLADLVTRPRNSAWWAWLNRVWQRLPVQGGQAIIESWAQIWKMPRVTAFSIVAMVAYGVQAVVFAWFCQVADTGVSSATCVLIFVQATLFGAATMLPGGLGAMEAALVLQLTARGVGPGGALSLAISIRLVTLWLAMAIGAISLLLASRSGQCAESG
jgi:glycosyltransferase 2 family protein